jgi:CheY-like chemotaxis protein
MTSEPAISLQERKAAGKPLVLVVDDDPIHHKLLELLAENLGITAYMASTCAEAVEAIKMFSFDVILMDVRMPGVDGPMCTTRIRALKEATSEIPIIAVTGDGTKENRKRCMEAGMNDFLHKPFTLEELNAKLCLWLRKRLD